MAIWQSIVVYAVWIAFCVQSARLLVMLFSGHWNSRD